ncbi:hypothetical protein SAMN05216278_1669 [Halopelagius longus]|uniref:DUF1059 domain-containing protein n=1 Tax=Halopelagius longus TaxID=1236180 RepID=A0A1H1B760_9EURY|nr:hypothetical protein SAMN05216278_1669 [Halopelagius longus]
MTYTVICIECGLRREMDELDDVLNFREAHKEQYDRHHVEFELIQ